MKRKLAIIISLLLIPTALGLNAQAEENGDTTIEVYVVTEENLTAYFDGEAGNDITYIIDGMEIKGEFTDIWGVIAQLKKDIKENFDMANFGYAIATNAQKQSDENTDQINENIETLGNHSYTLAVHYNAINDTYNKLYLLKDEVVAFEGHYFSFENKTNSTLNSQEDQISALRAELDNVNGFIAAIKNVFIGLIIAVFGLYLINRKYPFGEIIRNGKNSLRNGKQYKIVDYTKKTKTKKGLWYKVTHIRRNKEKSPVRFLSSFLQINK